MDASFTLLAICLVGLIVVAPVFLLIRSSALTRKAKSLENENRILSERLRDLTTRVYGIERGFEKLRENVAEGATVETQRPAEKKEAKPAPPASTPTAADPVGVKSPIALPATPVTPLPEIPRARPPLTTTPQPISFASKFMEKAASEAKASRSRSWADLEERLGANWLNKIGTAAFVIGVALLLNYSMHYLGPQGKIGLGYALSAILLLVGVFGERKERYRIGARAVLGGGWALAYFTTYALHNVSSVRLIDSPSIGFGLLFAVAVAMVAHSLRYDSEVTTGFAFLLAFASVAVSEIPMGGLVASALLSASLAMILRARRWFAVEPLAIVATYAVHWIWLNQVYERVGGFKLFPEFKASILLLSAYWAIYLVSYFLRKAKSARESQLLTASFLLNAAGYLALLHHQSFHPEWRFWFLLGAGAVYLGVSAWSQKAERRLSFVLASTLGAVLMIAAIPYRYSGGRLEILWLLETETLLAVGWRLLDGQLRKLAWAGTAILAGYVIFHDLALRFTLWQPPNSKTGWLLLALAAAFFINTRLKTRLGENSTQIDDAAFALAPAAATAFLLSSALIGLPFLWVGVVWAVAAVSLVEAGGRLRDPNVWMCGQASMLVAVLRLLVVNMAHGEKWHNVSLRLVTVGLSCAILYLASRRNAFPGAKDNAPSFGARHIPEWLASLGGITALYTAAGSLLLALLLLDEATSAAVGLAWGLFGLALLETAEALRDRPLLIQGRIVLLASFVRIFIADLNATSKIARLPVPVITVGLLAAIYYSAASSTRENARIRSALLWFGTLSLAALLRFELPIEWVAVGWAVLAVATYAIGWKFRLAMFRNQCYVMTLLCGIRCAFDNFYQLGPWHFTNTRTATVVACVLLMYALFAAIRFGNRESPVDVPQNDPGKNRWKYARMIWGAMEAYPQHLFFFVPTVLLTVLLSLEVRRGFLTAAWGGEALIVFLAVLKLDERAYRWFSLSLFLLCVGRIITVDVWNLDALGRIVSFMGLGVALLAVSFLYARHRELLRRVL